MYLYIHIQLESCETLLPLYNSNILYPPVSGDDGAVAHWHSKTGWLILNGPINSSSYDAWALDCGRNLLVKLVVCNIGPSSKCPRNGFQQSSGPAFGPLCPQSSRFTRSTLRCNFWQYGHSSFMLVSCCALNNSKDRAATVLGCLDMLF